MNNLKTILAGFLGLALHAAVSAQIYETEDAEGVPDFSDTPTAGAEVVDLPATNLMESPPPEELARPPQSPAAAAAHGDADGSGARGEDGPGVVYYGGDDADDPRARRRIDEERVNNALPGEPGAGAAVPGGEAELRHREAEHTREAGGEVHREVHHGAGRGR